MGGRRPIIPPGDFHTNHDHKLKEKEGDGDFVAEKGNQQEFDICIQNPSDNMEKHIKIQNGIKEHMELMLEINKIEGLVEVTEIEHGKFHVKITPKTQQPN